MNGVLSIDEIKDRILPICRKYEIKHAYLFGSYARNEATVDSDVDLRVVLGKKIGMLALNRLNTDLEVALQRSVDVITYVPKRDEVSFYKKFRDGILRDEILVYG